MFRFIFALAVVAQSLIVNTVQAASASLLFSPTSGTYTIGNNFSVSFNVSSVNQAINTVSAQITFSTSTLEVVDVSKSNTIMKLWLEDPTFSNTTGIITFTAVKFDPGYKGSGGKLVTIIFRGKKPGAGNIAVSSGRVFANDGQGTELLTNLGTASYTLIPSTIVPLPPTITSPTHPDQNRWYSNNNPNLRWSYNRSATAASFLLDQSPITDPDKESEGNLTTFNYTNVVEGTSYFHARLMNANGWGSSAHFRLQVDTEDPDYFLINLLPQSSLDNQASFEFDAFDKTSGIDYLNFQIDDECAQPWRSSTKGIFKTTPLLPGKHTLKATAFDKAGNFLFRTILFEVGGAIGEEGVAPTIIITPAPILITPTTTEISFVDRLQTIEKIFTINTIDAVRSFISSSTPQVVLQFFQINTWLLILSLLGAFVLVIILLVILWYAFSRISSPKKELGR
jgi:hypothetical protein